MCLNQFYVNASKIVFLSMLTLTLSYAAALPAANETWEGTDHFEQCLGLADQERLACYDKIAMQRKFGSPSAMAVSSDKGEQLTTVLEIDREVNPQQRGVGDTEEGTFVLTANSLQLDEQEQSDSFQELHPPASPMERMWELREDTLRPRFSLQQYHTNYVLFGQYSDRVNRAPQSPSPDHQVSSPTNYRHTEAKFRLSIRAKLAQSMFTPYDSLWFGYTQVSQWQVWSAQISRPFRATSYRPEIIYMRPIGYEIPKTGWTVRMAGVGFIHESNGQSNPLSRSWNRVYLGVGLDHRDMSIYARFWKRIPEKRSDDDNPDITTYMGRADINFNWDFSESNTLEMIVASNLRSSNKGSIQLGYYFPLSSSWGMNNYLRGYIQVFHGYGETIADYNFRRTAIGIGVAIKEW